MLARCIALAVFWVGSSSCGRNQEPSPGETTAVSREVVITAFVGESKIPAIKAVRAATGLGLADAKNLVDNLPAIVRKDVAPAEADALVRKLEESGMKAEARPTSGGLPAAR
jgi:large subunit ribosomal protein L7/L12